MFLFEVIGEAPTLTIVWATLVTIGLIGLVLSYLRWYLIVPTLLVLALFVLLMGFDLTEPDLYAEIQLEDPSYIPMFYLAATVSFFLHVVGLALNIRSKDKIRALG